MDFVIFDNGGKTVDRYCLVINERKVYSMAASPPWSVRYLCEVIDLDRKEAGRLVNLKDLPKEILKAIKSNSRSWFGKEAA